MTLSGCISYAPQNPWYVSLSRWRVQRRCAHVGDRIMSATIRENIVFNYEYDETFYNLVLDGKSLRTARSAEGMLICEG